MLTTDCCPQCGGEADSGPVRLVQDSCGHKKCRECLLSDETGCLSCTSYTPVYTELRTAGSGSVPNASAPFALAIYPEAEFTTTDVPPCSSFEEATPVHQLKSEASTSCNSLPEDVTVREPEQVEGIPNPLSADIKATGPSKRPPSFGLKEHIIFTPGKLSFLCTLDWICVKLLIGALNFQGNPPKYSCKKCNKSYNNRKAARYHNYCGAPATEKPHTCSECGQGFVTKGHLEYHVKSHTGSTSDFIQLCEEVTVKSIKLCYSGCFTQVLFHLLVKHVEKASNSFRSLTVTASPIMVSVCL